MTSQGEIVIGDITGMAFGGQGIMRRDGFVIFVPFTTIGDKISCRIIQNKQSFATAELVEIFSPGPTRIQPLCPYFGVCGGCQLQHINYSEQIAHKLQNVGDAFKRIGHFHQGSETALSIVPAKLQWAYRRHINLSLKVISGHYQAGYIAVDNHSLIETEECAIFIPRENPILKQIQEVVRNFKIVENAPDGKLVIFKQPNDKFILFFQFKNAPKNFSELIKEAMKKFPNWSGILMESTKGTLQVGDLTAFMKVEEFQFAYSPKAFIQNHPEQSLNIYRELCALAKEANARKVLDLYCGIGITTLLLSKSVASITGIESNPDAIRMARMNALHNDCKNVLFELGDAKKIVQAFLINLSPDFVVINPPRIGLAPKVVSSLLKNPPKNIVYISCMPSTLARDLFLLCKEKKYQLISSKVFDMFPQTGHVETIVRLTRKE
jgi:23S rRNA (uracil1939-C5)-methyltransferase